MRGLLYHASSTRCCRQTLVFVWQMCVEVADVSGTLNCDCTFCKMLQPLGDPKVRVGNARVWRSVNALLVAMRTRVLWPAILIISAAAHSISTPRISKMLAAASPLVLIPAMICDTCEKLFPQNQGSYVRHRYLSIRDENSRARLHGGWISLKSGDPNPHWPFKVKCNAESCPFCKKGYDNNTCTFACDGICDEPTADIAKIGEQDKHVSRLFQVSPTLVNVAWPYTLYGV